MKRALISMLLALMVALLVPAGGEAQVLKKIKEKAKQEIGKKEDKIAEGVVKCAVADKACILLATGSGKQVVVTDSAGKPLPKEQQDAAVAEAKQQQQQPASQLKPGEGAWANYDFVPGEKVLFFEDFTKDRVGNFPQRLEFLNGNMEIVDWNGKRWLRMNTTSAFQVVLKDPLPDRFTIEMDLTIPWGPFVIYTGECRNAPEIDADDRATILFSQFYRAGMMGPKRKPEAIVYPSAVLPDSIFTDSRYSITKPVRVRVHADGRYMKVYLEENRVANVPNIDIVRTNNLVFHVGIGPGNKGGALLTNISINAGGREMYDALMADGRVVTQGIFFDTGSDRLRPESTPTLKEIGAMLQEHPDLKLRIEGHTDAVGDDAANLQLSDRRAASVKAFLVEAYKVDAARLETQGLGETKPVGSNDTAEGRQQNRRVELVKL